MRPFLLGVFATLTLTFFSIHGIFLESDAQSPTKMNFGEPLPANAFVELSKAVMPSVVNISTTSRPKRQPRMRGVPPGYPGGGPSDIFEQFFGPLQRGPSRPQQALGTGFIIRQDGLILTNNHVIDEADVIKVQISEKDGTFYTAELIGQDKRTDLALIKIDAKRPLPAVALGSSKNLMVGEWVAALGNPLGLGHTISKGIVSAIGRELDELNRFPFIQTDASINPGNSGGPLVNLKGEVVGVNSAMAANAQGIGFAIPIDEAKSVIAILEKEGGIKRGFLGVATYPYPVDPRAADELGLKTTKGTLVTNVVPNSPADAAGLQEYDFIVKFDGKTVESAQGLIRLIGDAAVGKIVKLEIIREGKSKTVEVKLTEHPDDKKSSPTKKKTYRGQKAPFDLGFTIANYSKELAQEYDLPPLNLKRPVVIDVDPESPAESAGLAIGDIILDVNRDRSTRNTDLKDTDVLKLLKENKMNFLLVQRGMQKLLLNLEPKP